MRKYWIELSWLGALAVTLAAGWCLGQRTQSVHVNALRSESDDLIRFIDESYVLLKDEGFHIQLALDQDARGRYRLRADSAELTEELKAKLRALDQEPHQPSPKAP